MTKSTWRRTPLAALLAALVVSTSMTLSPASASAGTPASTTDVAPGDDGPPAGWVRLEAVRYNGGVDENVDAFVPAPLASAGSSTPAIPTVTPTPSPDVLGVDLIPIQDAPALPSVPDIASPTTVIPSGDAPAPPAPETLNVDLVRPVSSEAEFQATVATLVNGAGAQLVSARPGVALADVPTTVRTSLTNQMAARGIELREPRAIGFVINDAQTGKAAAPEFGSIVGSNVNVTHANLYHQAGFTGKGVKIGIIDFFEIAKFWNTTEMGPIPVAGVTAKCIESGVDCTAKMFDGVVASDSEQHGEAVAETIRDMAPDAELYVASASSETDYRAIIDWFNANGVSIISRSLGDQYDSAGDGDGPLAKLAAYAASHNMVWVNSGGNSGRNQYYRQTVRLLGNNVAFGPAGTETMLPLRGCMFSGGIRWANDWYLPATERTDYDAYLWVAPTGQPSQGHVMLKSERRQSGDASPLESFDDVGCPPAGSSFYLQVVWRSGPRDGDTLEILDYSHGFANYTQPEYSAATSIPTSKSRSVLSVGAVDPPEGATIGAYSSQGPSNDGRIVPSLSAPSGFRNSIYGTFAGTSAAAPTVAGGLALMKQAGMAKDSDNLADLARNSVVDLGTPGPDNVFGTGKFVLPDPPSGTFSSITSRFQPLAAPTRLLDTRAESPVGPPNLMGKMYYGEIRKLPVRGVLGVSTDATAVAVNLTSVTPDAPSYMQAYPTGYGAVGGYSNVNNDTATQIRSNFAIIPIGKDGTISIYAKFGGHVVVDSLGYFTPADTSTAAGRFRSIGTSQRVLNTRTLGTPLGNGNTINVPNPTGVNMADVSALVVTVTGAGPTQPAVIQAYPRGQPAAVGKTSTLNLDPLMDTANLAIVPTDGGGIALSASVMNGGHVDAIVDVIGYITSATAATGSTGLFVPVVPGRALDTRTNGGFLTDATVRTVVANDAPGVKVPDTASGVIWNTTVTETQRPGYETVWAWNTTRPTTSALNWGPGSQTRASAVISQVTTGRANFAFTADTKTPMANAQLVVDVFGYFT